MDLGVRRRCRTRPSIRAAAQSASPKRIAARAQPRRSVVLQPSLDGGRPAQRVASGASRRPHRQRRGRRDLLQPPGPLAGARRWFDLDSVASHLGVTLHRRTHQSRRRPVGTTRLATRAAIRPWYADPGSRPSRSAATARTSLRRSSSAASQSCSSSAAEPSLQHRQKRGAFGRRLTGPHFGQPRQTGLRVSAAKRGPGRRRAPASVPSSQTRGSRSTTWRAWASTMNRHSGRSAASQAPRAPDTAATSGCSGGCTRASLEQGRQLIGRCDEIPVNGQAQPHTQHLPAGGATEQRSAAAWRRPAGPPAVLRQERARQSG